MREGDVRARFHWTTRGNPIVRCSLTAVIECKSSAANPWVAMYDTNAPGRADTLADWAAYAHASIDRTLAFAKDEWVVTFSVLPTARSGHSCERSGDDKANKPNLP